MVRIQQAFICVILSICIYIYLYMKAVDLRRWIVNVYHVVP